MSPGMDGYQDWDNYPLAGPNLPMAVALAGRAGVGVDSRVTAHLYTTAGNPVGT